jgi:sugar phosphate isomerase/epimerase
MQLYISTLALRNYSIQEILRIAEEKNWSIEFSSGIPFNENIDQLYKNTSIKRIPHNYFPASKVPFVLNLASSNQEIRKKSIIHCKNGLLLAKHSNAPFYSAHAGFCIDPNPEELGKKIAITTKFEKKNNLDLFKESINEILDFAFELNLDFLIENNVIAQFNLVDNENPLLCTNSDDIIDLFDEIDRPNFHLLLDTGHLKVSSQTLGRDINEELNKIKKYIKAVHHSDNDGFSDTNDLLDESYWFSKNISTFSNLIHVLEVNTNTISDIESQFKIIAKWM